MQQIKTLVFMQLKDKLDVSWMYSRKSRIRTIILALLKFVLITAIYGAVLYATNLLGLVLYSDMPQVMTFVLSIALFLSLCACSWGLMKTLYFSEDNKVLITFPVQNNKIFISKLLVFYIYEIKKSFSFTIPLIIGCAINLSLRDCLHWTSYLWMIIPIIFLISLPVLLGALLSIPLMYLYRFFNKYSILKAFVALVIVVAGVSVSIYLINLIPVSIDLMKEWPNIRTGIMNFLTGFEKNHFIMTNLTRTLIGERKSYGFYSLSWWTLLKSFILIASVSILAVLNYFVSRPLFFKMMSKNFEFNKNKNDDGVNVKHSQFIAFNLKEFRISFRSLDISINYLSIYILIPILTLLLNKIFVAIERNNLGIRLSYAFNLLLILLPLLASNSLIATLYSKEGRAGYIKKTKPVKPIVPLFAKLTFNLILSFPCVLISVIIFGKFAEFGALETIILFFAILLIHYGHMFYCATLDITNPQNELYATVGDSVNNSNEIKASVVAFILTGVYSLFAFKLFSEIGTFNLLTTACVKLLIISSIIFVYLIVSFVLKIKAFYGND